MSMEAGFDLNKRMSLRSRICVKNLPSNVTKSRLREMFSQKGEVTDVKLLRTKDGKSRQFGFVGFRSDHEAQVSIQHFNNSFIDTQKITCEISCPVGDPNIPRPWSRHSNMKFHPSKVKTVTAGSKASEKNKKPVADDPQLEEFLQLMQPRSKSKLWANDTLAAPSIRPCSKSKLLANGPSLRKTKTVTVINEKENLFKEEANKSGVDKPDRSVHDDVLSDMDYFRSRMRKVWSEDSESRDVDGSNVFDDSDGIKKSNPPLNPQKDQVLESGRLFIHNLPYPTTKEEVEDHFSKYGSISHIHFVVDKHTKQFKGTAYVLFELPESAVRALEDSKNLIFQGRLVVVMPAQQNKQQTNKLSKYYSDTFKGKRDSERKASEAGGNTLAWNSLYMRPATVIENMSRKYGVSKTDLLDKETDNLAVRIALGETQVIAETKKALSSAGVNVSSLEEFTAAGKSYGLKRSDHVILAKNLPYGSSERELADMFGKFGSLEKVILPPTRTLALAIFLEHAEARAAFKSLQYKRYKDAPLYLEWAPDNILKRTSVNCDFNTVLDENNAKRSLQEQQIEQISEADLDPDRIESRSLYIRGLDFKTSDEALKRHFNEHMKGGKLLSATVVKHKLHGNNVSSGFGFLEFDSMDTAARVHKDLQNTVLDDKKLLLEPCHAKKDKKLSEKTVINRSSTKIIIMNVAFEATKEDIRLLFNPFGQIKSIRMPRKIGKYRGFCFVEYMTKQGANEALKALTNTHLYGRHLIMERAKEDESLEDLRARTAAQFTDSSSKLSKKRNHLTVLDQGNVKFQRIAY